MQALAQFWHLDVARELNKFADTNKRVLPRIARRAIAEVPQAQGGSAVWSQAEAQMGR